MKARTLIVSFASLLLAIYFSALLWDHWWPGLGHTAGYFAYILSLPVALLLLLVFTAVGIVLSAKQPRGPGPFGRVHPTLAVGGIGLILLAAAVVADQLAPRDLPVGSGLESFNSEVWTRDGAWEFVKNDITPRQKMLRDVVENVLPGKSRTEIEAVLGPSLETSYFASLHWDLIYVTGPERQTPFAIDSEWLLIWLDDSGRFEKFEICMD